MPGLVHVVDDDASFRTAIERRLKHAGYEVETHSSAQHLLDRLPGVEKPECILLDVQMPGLNGLDLQDRLIARGHRIPIIFMTGYPNDSVRARAMKAGAVCFLNKPFSEDHFIGCIEKALKAA